MRDRIAIVDMNIKKFKVIPYKQYDKNNILRIVVTENGRLLNISNYTSVVNFKLPSGRVYEVPSEIKNNSVEVILTEDLLKEYGKVVVEVEFSDEKQVVTTFSMFLNVEKSITDDGVQGGSSTTSHIHENMFVLNQITQDMINTISDIKEIVWENIDLSNYYTKEEVDEKIENINIDNVNLSDYAKKEELETKADNLFQTDMLTVSSLGGISAGVNLNNMSLQDVLTKLLFPYVEPTVSASISYTPIGGVYECGQTVKVTSIKANVVKKSEDITSVRFYQNNSLINEITNSVSLGGEFVYTFPLPISVVSSMPNNYFQVRVEDNNKRIISANTTALNFYYPYYYGVIDEGAEITEDLIKTLTKQVTAKANKSYTYNPNYQCMVIAYPKTYGVLKSILDPNGFEQINSFNRIEIAITGLDENPQLYYVYSNDASTNTNFTMKFNY